MILRKLLNNISSIIKNSEPYAWNSGFITSITAFPIALTLLIGCSEENKEITSKEIYSAVTSADYPPFEYLQDGKIVGFDIDLIQAVADKIGIKIKVNDVSFDGILGALKSGRTDLAISAITPTTERKAAVDFSDEYYSTTRVLACSDLSSVHNITDLANLNTGVQAGSIYENYANNDLKDMVSGINIKSLPRLPELIQEMKTRRISCILLGQQEAEDLIKNTSGVRLINLGGEAGFAIALQKGSTLLGKINAALKELNADGTIEKIKQKWFQK